MPSAVLSNGISSALSLNRIIFLACPLYFDSLYKSLILLGSRSFTVHPVTTEGDESLPGIYVFFLGGGGFWL